jgi:hypothetical protein
VPHEPVWPVADAEQTDVLTPAPASRPPRGASAERCAGSGSWPARCSACSSRYAIDLLVSQGNVPRGVTVAGVDVGGLNRPEAEERLRAQIEPRLVKQVAVQAGDVTATVKPARAGLSLDWQSTLDQAGHPATEPVHAAQLVLHQPRGRRDHPAQLPNTVFWVGALPRRR